MKKALVCGAGGFIGGHLVKKLKDKGYWVRGVDIKAHEYRTTHADEFFLLDLRRKDQCWEALTVSGGPFDEVYQLAADMGGMGFIHTAECEIMHNSALININMTDTAAKTGVSRYFFSSSACVYPDMKPGDPMMTEAEAIPAEPDNEYGWEKLYAERMAQAYARHHPMNARIARFQNCYGPFGTWRGGREKAPAAICRKVAMAEDGGSIDVWGDGNAVRGFTYIDDLVDGIYRLTQSDLEGAANIGTEEYMTVNHLVETVIAISGKNLSIKHVEGPVGVLARNFSKERMRTIGWEATTSFRDGMEKTYTWVAAQVEKYSTTCC